MNTILNYVIHFSFVSICWGFFSRNLNCLSGNYQLLQTGTSVVQVSEVRKRKEIKIYRLQTTKLCMHLSFDRKQLKITSTKQIQQSGTREISHHNSRRPMKIKDTKLNWIWVSLGKCLCRKVSYSVVSLYTYKQSYGPTR